MSKLINVSNNVYDELTRRKKARNASYSEVISELLQERDKPKTIGWDEILAEIKKQDATFKGKKEKIDHDLIAHGVSRDSA